MIVSVTLEESRRGVRTSRSEVFRRVALGVCSRSYCSATAVGETSLIVSCCFFLFYRLEFVGSFTQKQPVQYISLEMFFPEQSSLNCRSLLERIFFLLD